MEKLNAILQKYVAQGSDTEGKLLGAAFVLTNSQEVFYAGSAGRVGFEEDSRKFDVESFTWVASLTKLITATCIMQLVEQKAVGLDEDVRNIVPELAEMQILRGFDDDQAPILEENTEPITLRMLLTHTVGLCYDIGDPEIMRWAEFVGRKSDNLDWNREGFVTPFKFRPGDGWCYGTAVDWAAIFLETITGQTIGEYMVQHVFEPLRMKDTGFWPEKLPQTRTRTLASAHRDDSGRLIPGELPIKEVHEIESGGSGVFSTARDYAIFMNALMKGKLIKQETLAHMFAPQLDEKQAKMLEATAYDEKMQSPLLPEFPKGIKLNHGLGGVLNLEDAPGKRRKGSMCWSGMANSHWWIDRQTGIGGVLVVNVFPHGDPVVKKLYNELELATYEAMTAS